MKLLKFVFSATKIENPKGMNSIKTAGTVDPPPVNVPVAELDLHRFYPVGKYEGPALQPIEAGGFQVPVFIDKSPDRHCTVGKLYLLGTPRYWI